MVERRDDWAWAALRLFTGVAYIHRRCNHQTAIRQSPGNGPIARRTAVIVDTGRTTLVQSHASRNGALCSRGIAAQPASSFSCVFMRSGIAHSMLMNTLIAITSICMSVTHNAGDHLFFSLPCTEALKRSEIQARVVSSVCTLQAASPQHILADIDKRPRAALLADLVHQHFRLLVHSFQRGRRCLSERYCDRQSVSQSLRFSPDPHGDPSPSKGRPRRSAHLPRMAEFSSSATATLPAGSR